MQASVMRSPHEIASQAGAAQKGRVETPAQESLPSTVPGLRVAQENGQPLPASAPISAPRFEAVGELGVLHGPVPFPPVGVPDVVATPGVSKPTRDSGLTGGGIAGDARDRRTGEPITGAILELESNHSRQKLVVDQSGQFSVSGVPPGMATLIATAPDYVTTKVALDIPNGTQSGEITVRDLRIELDRAGWLSGAVTGTDGETMDHLVVEVGDLKATTDRDGRFVLRGVPPGRVRVEAHRGGQMVTEDVEIRANEESRIELRMR
jgi:hypothetical protein